VQPLTHPFPGHLPGPKVTMLSTLFLVALALLALPAVGFAADYTWTGATPTVTPEASNWSKATNWEGSAPSGTVGTLTFPALTNPACTTEPPSSTCYASNNDIGGLNVDALSIDDGVGYRLTGNAITLGAGGITSTATTSNPGYASIGLPITLSAPQTWSIDGGSFGGQLGVKGNVTGTSQALALHLSTFLNLESDIEAGPVTVTGGNVGLGNPMSSATLNGSDGNTVSFETSGLFALNGSIGPFTIGEHSHFQLGQGYSFGAGSGAGTLSAGGAILQSNSLFSTFINQAGTTAGTDYSQLSATGPVNLNGGNLEISDGESQAGGSFSCNTLTLGDTDTLITTTGALTGTFHNVPDGTVVPIQCFGTGSAPSARINYSAHAVTATVVSGTSTPTSTALQVSNASLLTGEAVTYTATVTPTTLGASSPSGSVAFFDGGQPIGSCTAQPLSLGSSFSTATCTVSYPTAGSHAISASYSGDASYEVSASSPQTVTVQESVPPSGSVPAGTPPGGTPPPTITPPPVSGSTGQRAAALKRCKKVHRRKAHARCVRKARKLPV
jgi:hypothetical protein